MRNIVNTLKILWGWEVMGLKEKQTNQKYSKQPSNQPGPTHMSE
jgi:hypothetical protein